MRTVLNNEESIVVDSNNIKANKWIYLKQITSLLKTKPQWVAFPLFFLVAGSFFIANHKSNNEELTVIKSQTLYNEKILKNISNINDQLELLSKSTTNANQKNLISSIEGDMSEIKKSINDIAKSADVQQVSNQLTGMKEDIEKYMTDIKRAVSSSVGDRQYLNPEILPFRILSVDIISGQPYASVEYADHVTPVGVSDVIAGWKLVSADYDSSVVEFMNDKKQYIQVSLG